MSAKKAEMVLLAESAGERSLKVKMLWTLAFVACVQLLKWYPIAFGVVLWTLA